MANQLPTGLRRAAELQCGVVTSSQAAQAGLSRNAVRARVRTGRWQQLHRGVYATFSGQLNRDAVLWAAILHAGSGALLSHLTAAELAGLTDAPGELIHITVPADRRVSRAPGIVTHLCDRARDVAHPARLPPQTRVEETVLDLVAGARTIDDAVGWVTRALGRRLTTQARLREAIAQRPRMRWRPELTELLNPDLAGLMSVLERRYVKAVERPHRLPAAQRQARIKRGDRTEYRDLWYAEYATCVELDGELAHPSESRWRDIRRDNATASDGGTTLRYGWLDLTAGACRTAAEVDRTLRRRGFPGAHPCGPACPVGRAPASGPRATTPVLRAGLTTSRRRPYRPNTVTATGAGAGRGPASATRPARNAPGSRPAGSSGRAEQIVGNPGRESPA